MVLLQLSVIILGEVQECVTPAHDSILYQPIWHHHLGLVEIILHHQHQPSAHLWFHPTA